MPMNIYEFFSCFTNLPILLDDVCEQALEHDRVDEFIFSVKGGAKLGH